jgi:hypothetical integral membrane protein (TIGR02206 family)
MESILFRTEPYKNFTFHHGAPIVILSLLFLLLIQIGKTKSDKQKWKWLFWFSLIPFFAVISRIIFTLYEGIFSIQEELPLHLCRIAALSMPFIIYFKNRKWINIFYFLIIVGTLQAIITADLEFSFPHYSYIIYWIFHVSLVWLPLAVIIFTGIVPRRKDMINAFVMGNIYMLCTLIINFSIGSNYFYTKQKPPGGSLLDLFGPWPIYIFVVEGLAVILFLLAYLPFRKQH